MKKKSSDEARAQADLLCSGSVDVIQENDLYDRLKKSIDENKPLRIKLGVDPTSPYLHLGHTVLFQKMKQFQDLGHEVIFLIGDFTGMIGDPSGRSQMRIPLSREQVLKNAETYKTQIFKILNPDETTIRFNSEWMGKMSAGDLIDLASKYTVARIIERDDFQKRFNAKYPIGIHEFLYPLIQGYDSVVLKADVELGGTDQKFNLLVGRALQKLDGQVQQVVLTMPLLEGTDGVRKMSKSFGNEIALESKPSDMFGKIMSVSDELMQRFYELLTDISFDKVQQLHPMKAKLNLAALLVERFHGPEDARKAKDQFDVTVGRKAPGGQALELKLSLAPKRLIDLLYEQAWTKSKGEARRLVQQGAVELDGKKISDPNYEIFPVKGERFDLKVGKKIRYTLKG
ncbi:MAG: tyrosine--tRNA ligase [Nitrospiria bacterium]